MRRIRQQLFLVAVASLVVLAGCSGTAPLNPTPSGGPTPAASAPPARGASAASTAPRVRNYSALYRRTISSVVLVRVTTPSATVTGSGFVYDDRGDIVTNHHVIAGAQSVEVQFHDGTWENASVVGSDAYSDLAVLRVDALPPKARPLPVAQSTPRPGEPVAAIGNPFGLTGSITTGVVSGVNRTMPTAHSFTIPGTVQTDAAINPGNSGGPLLTRDGVVVGVNRATEGVNVGFAISSMVIRRVVPALIANGSYSHTYVGISTMSVTPVVARANGLARAQGLMVVRTLSDGPARGHLQAATGSVDRHGQRVPVGGDVIVAVDGTRVRSGEAFSRYLLLHTRPGERVPMTVIRNDTRTTVDVTLAARPSP
ncbi:MAG: S1C family serine protease [Salinigranum sp.]